MDIYIYIVKYSRFVLKKKQIFEDNFLKKIIINKYDTFQKVIVL